VVAVQNQSEREHGLVQGELAADAGPLARPERLVGVRRALFGLAGGEPVGIEPVGIGPYQRVAVQQRQQHAYPVSLVHPVSAAQHGVAARGPEIAGRGWP